MTDDEPYVLVTVGTTSFDRLIKEVSSTQIVQVLQSLGYRRLLLQYGRGEYVPVESKDGPFRIESYRYKDSIQGDIANASLVISHAGAGSIMETLGAGCPLVVVINEQLMGNHQLELAKQLADDGHLYYSTCSDLSHTLEHMDIGALHPYTPGDPSKFASFLDRCIGVL